MQNTKFPEENIEDHGYDHDIRSNTKGMIMKEIIGKLDFI